MSQQNIRKQKEISETALKAEVSIKLLDAYEPVFFDCSVSVSMPSSGHDISVVMVAATKSLLWLMSAQYDPPCQEVDTCISMT